MTGSGQAGAIARAGSGGCSSDEAPRGQHTNGGVQRARPLPAPRRRLARRRRLAPKAAPGPVRDGPLVGRVRRARPLTLRGGGGRHRLRPVHTRFRPADPRGPGGVDEWDNHGNAPLHLALILNRAECARLLIQEGRADCRLQYARAAIIGRPQAVLPLTAFRRVCCVPPRTVPGAAMAGRPRRKPLAMAAAT